MPIVPRAVVQCVRRRRKDRVLHVRLNAFEMAAIEQAAAATGLSISAFTRSLALEGAGVLPFLTDEDRTVLAALVFEVRSLGVNLNQMSRRLNASGVISAVDFSIKLTAVQELLMAVRLELQAHRIRGIDRRRGTV